jgi:hypothetical protein
LSHHHQRLPQGLGRILCKPGAVGRQQGQGGVVAEHGPERRIARHRGHSIDQPVIPGGVLGRPAHLPDDGMDGVFGEKPARRAGGKRIGKGAAMGEIDRADHLPR